MNITIETMTELAGAIRKINLLKAHNESLTEDIKEIRKDLELVLEQIKEEQ